MKTAALLCAFSALSVFGVALLVWAAVHPALVALVAVMGNPVP